MVPSWWRNAVKLPHGGKNRFSASRSRRKYLPRLEQFEDRLVPTMVSIPTTLIGVGGGVVTVPINVDTLNDSAHGNIGLSGGEFLVYYNPSVLAVAPSDVQLGAIFTNGATSPGNGYTPTAPNGWTVTATSTISGFLEIALSNSGTGIITGNGAGSLATINFHVKSNAAFGATMIDLAASPPTGSPPSTQLSDLHGNNYVLNPAPQTNTSLTGGYSYTGTDPVDGTITIQGPHLAITGLNTANAGVPYTFTVTAENANNTTNTGYAGTVHFSSSDAGAALQGDATLTAGVGTFSATLKTLGNQTLTATDISGTGIASATNTISVTPGTVTHFSVTGAPGSVELHYPFSITVIALDQFQNVATGYTGTVQFTSTDFAAQLPGNTTLTNGKGVFSVALGSTGAQLLMVSDAGNPGISGSTTAIYGTGNPSPLATHLVITGVPANNQAGVAFTFSVTAFDASNNLVPSYVGPVHFASSDSKALLPPDSTLTSGMGTFTATFITAGSQTITATGQSNLASFSQAAGSPVSSVVNASFLASGDFTGNGKLDLVVGNYEGAAGQIGILLGNGDGTFKVGQVIALGGGTDVVAVGDFRNNGTLDLAVDTAYSIFNNVLTPEDTVSVLLGNGNGTFAAPASYNINLPGFYTFTGFAVADLTNNGNLDLAVTSVDSNSIAMGAVSVFLGNGNGTFASPVSSRVGPFPSSIGVGDFNNDGMPDLAVVNDGSNTVPGYVTVLLGNGNGTFGSASNLAVGSAPWQAAVGDFDGTGNLDLAVTNVNSNNVSVLLGNGNGTFAPAVNYSAGTAPFGVATADINGDGILDLIVANANSNTISVLLGNGDGTFGNLADMSFAGNPFGVAVGDFNGDGAPDLAIANYGSNNVTILLHDTITGSAAASVSSAAASHFAVITTGASAGAPFSFTVEALDPFGNINNGYSGTVHFTSTDPGAATLPGDSTLSNGVGVFSATLQTPPSQTLTAADANNSSISGSSVVAISAPVNHFLVNVPMTAVAGTGFNFTVTALDSSGFTATGYNGTVTFKSSDALALLPPNGTFANGVGVFSATLATAGSQTLTVVDTTASSVNGTSSGVTVSPTSFSGLAVSAPATAPAGSSFSITVAAVDKFGNTVPNYSGTVTFSSGDAGAVLPPTSSISGGSGVFSVVLKTAGSKSITATDTANSLTGTTNVSVVPAPASHFAVTAPPAAILRGPITLLVTALDQFNNVVTGYTGTVHFTSSDSQAVLPADATLTGGNGTFTATLKTAGNQTVTATDTGKSFTGTSGPITVGPGAATHFLVSAPTTAAAGGPFNFTVTAQDLYFNTVPSYSGTLHFSSTDSSATLPPDATLTSGSGVFSATLMTSGNQTLMAFDVAANRLSGLSGPITVGTIVSNPATHFSISAPTSTPAGSPLLVVVTALDQNGNTAAGFSGTVHFSSSDLQAALPANATLTNGVGFFAAALKTAGNQSIAVAEVGSPGITGNSGAIAVDALAANHFGVVAPANAVTGAPAPVTVTALDLYNNPATAYHGTVTFTSSDSGAVLPANDTLVAGQGVFNVTFKTAGKQAVTAADTSNTSLTGTSNTIATVGLIVTSFAPTASGFTATFSKPFNVTQINLYDASGLLGPDDVLLTGPNSPPISFSGSLIVDPTDTTITFVKTSDFNGINFNPATGVLAAGTYTATFRSASNGFKDLSGVLLDGTGTGNSPGTNFVTTFVVSAPPVVVGVPSFARGPDSALTINLPNTQTAGIPLNLSNAAGVTSGHFVLQYNSAFLTVTSATVNSALPGATLTLSTSSTPGNAVIDFTSPTALTSGVIRLGGLVATVPNSAASSYTLKALLDFSTAQLNGGAIAVTGADAVQVVAYLGDVSGDGQFSSIDAADIARVATGLDSNASTGTLGGFAAYRLADPIILADLTSSGSVGSADVTVMNSFLAGTPRPQLPPIPLGLTISPNGPDPSLSLGGTGFIPIYATAGGTVTVPVDIDTARPDGSSGMTEAILALEYDPGVFNVSAAGVQLGTVPQGGSDWQLTTTINTQTGQIGIDLFSTTPILSTAGGSLVTISLYVRDTAPIGATSLALATEVNPTGQHLFRTEVADATGAFVLHPAVTTAGSLPAAPELLVVDSTQATVYGEQEPLSAAATVRLPSSDVDAPITNHQPLGATSVVEQVFARLELVLMPENLFSQSDLMLLSTSATDQALLDGRDLALLMQPALTVNDWTDGQSNVERPAWGTDLGLEKSAPDVLARGLRSPMAAEDNE